MTSPPTYSANAILKRGHGRFADVRQMNIAVVTKVSDSLKTMLGPKGMDKLLVNGLGDFIVTHDGLTTLEHMEISNPVTRLLVEVAKSQEEATGDGTKTVVVLTGELLRNAGVLLGKKVHPRTIMNGYSKAAVRALETLRQGASTMAFSDRGSLKRVAETIIGGRITGGTREALADLIGSAIISISEERRGRLVFDIDQISTRKVAGGRVSESSIVNGCVIFKEKPSSRMPERIEHARIALIGSSLDPLTYRADQDMKEYAINTPADYRGVIEGERVFNKAIVGHAQRAGVDALFCRKRISEPLVKAFAEAHILAFNLVSDEDLLRLEKATGAKTVKKLDELDAKDVGRAGLVEYRRVSGDEMLFVEGCSGSKAITVILRGGTQQVVDELERVFQDAIKGLSVAVKNEQVVQGGGATEMQIANALRAYAKSIPDREQLAVEAYGEAFEAIPMAIATNAGLDKIDSLAELRAGHDRGLKALGVDGIGCQICDVSKAGLYDVFSVKENAIKVATETAIMILAISDLITITDRRAIKQDENADKVERQRLHGDKIKEAFKTEGELKQVERLHNDLMERQRHPETL
jgi:chaperonin GroEL (HSP60 family)